MKTVHLTGRLVRESVNRSEITTSLEIQRPYDHSVTITIVPSDDQEDQTMFDEVSKHFDADVTIRCSVDKDGYLTATSSDISAAEEFSPRKDDSALPLLLRSDADMIESLRGSIHGKYQSEVDDWIADIRRSADVLEQFDKVLWEAAMERLANR